MKAVATGDAAISVARVRLKRDTDGDGLSDALESQPLFAGPEIGFVNTDPASADTDGDGLLDGEEVAGVVEDYAYGQFFSLNGNPEERDSDHDGIPDFDEAQLGSKLLNPDTDGDGLTDFADPDVFGPQLPVTGRLANLSATVFCTFQAPVVPGAQVLCDTFLDDISKTDAMERGAVLGEVGFKGVCALGGCFRSRYRKSPYYLVGWILMAVTPVVEVPADLRDGITNLAHGSPEALFDFVSLLPFFADDAPKVASVIGKWIAQFPAKAAEAARVLAKFVFEWSGPAIRKAGYGALGMGADYKRVILDADVDWARLHKKLERAQFRFGGKLESPITLEDIQRISETRNGNLVYLVDTGKWIDDRAPIQTAGLRHIISRHVHPNSKFRDLFKRSDGYPVKAGGTAKDSRPTTLFPREMTPTELENLVMRAATEGKVVQSSNFKENIVFSVPDSYKYDIDEVKVVVRSESGLIKTAYPRGGSDVTKIT